MQFKTTSETINVAKYSFNLLKYKELRKGIDTVFVLFIAQVLLNAHPLISQMSAETFFQ